MDSPGGKEALEALGVIVISATQTTASPELVLVSELPFGGRMELLAHTLGTLEADGRVARGLDFEVRLPGGCLSVLVILCSVT